MIRHTPKKIPAGYDLSLEILASLPLCRGVDLGVLAADFKIPVKYLRRILSNLRAAGFPANEFDRTVVLGMQGRAMAIQAATSYWEANWPWPEVAAA